jgi:acyl transferase domain-containing protein
MSESDSRLGVDPIAIVGMSGRFPGARDIREFWNNLAQGVESIDFFTDEELAAAGVDEQLRASPAYVGACGVCEDEDQFDARYFGFSPREAQALDPQQRLFLECAVEALEHAGLDPDSFSGPVGVYAGVGVSTYLKLIEANPEFVDLVGGLQVLIGTNKDHLTTHVSYKLNLRGPSIAIQTACSTSLVAVVQACQALLTYQCDAALAGGVSIAVPQREGYLHEEGGIESPDGHCRAFDARAQGTVGGNGVGIVVLKRLADARAAGDTIHALIRGFAVNNDGAQKVGYTAPSIDGQAEVIALAQAMAGVTPDSISYVEAHGTATALGDPIEIAALTQAFRARTSAIGFCAVGSVKSNIGHLDCAAGVASLIKTVLALQHRQIPPSLHFESPNPRIDFATSPFYVNAALRTWDGPTPRRAGVSSFGIGGTNAHVIVEEAPSPDVCKPSRLPQLVTVSARSPEALARVRARLAEYLEATSESDFSDVCYTLHVGRRAHEYRAALTCRTTADAIAALRSSGGARTHQHAVTRKDLSVAFLFPGQGSQYVGMARGLYETEPVFRETLDSCADVLRVLLGRDLRDLLCGEPDSERSTALDETWLAQPALFSVEYSLARTWMAWGIRPSAMLGHSVGEYTAACLAGVFTLEDALELVAVRGRLVQSVPRGAMLAVALPVRDISALADDIEIAAINAPALTTVAGEVAGIERFADLLRERAIVSKRLHTSHAFHSRALDSILDDFRLAVERTPRRRPALRYVSNVTGRWIDPEDAIDPDYYVRQLRGTVQFAEGVQTLMATGESLLLEVGPGQALTSLVRQQIPPGSEVEVFSSLGSARDGDDLDALVDVLGRLWTRGVTVDWAAFHAGERRRKVALPAYPFERERYWVDSMPDVSTDVSARPGSESGSDDDAGVRLYAPAWSRLQRLADSVAPLPDDDPDTCWLIFRDEAGLGDSLAARLREFGRRVVVVRPGADFERRSDDVYIVRPSEPADYRDLHETLQARGLSPRRVIHLWTVDASSSSADVTSILEHGSFSVLAFVQGLGLGGSIPASSLLVVTIGAQSVLEDDEIRPTVSTVLGPCRTIPQEYPTIACGALDLQMPRHAQWPDNVVDRILADACITESGLTVAYRGGYRWLQTYEPLDRDIDGAIPPTLRENGVYLITGGLGQLGRLIAQWVAARTRARLILTSRVGLPPREQWPRDGSEDPESPLAAAIEFVRAIEEGGCAVEVLAVDVADEGAMTDACDAMRRRYGAVNGVFHCAGATRAEHFAPIASVTRALWEEHLRPKVHGVNVLDRALTDHAPDFVVLMSSLSAILGGLGFLPYASANLFMDAFAQHKRRHAPAQWISVNWDGWNLDDDDVIQDDGDGDMAGGLTADDGLAALECILAAPTPQVVVVAGDLEPRLRQWIALDDVRAPVAESSDSHLFARPRLTVAYRAPEGELQCHMTRLWQQLLGVAQVGADDNFFELGGHSLLAIQLAARLREHYRIELGVDLVFTSPTVASLALEVDRRRHGDLDAAALEALVKQVEEMDESQVRALLAESRDSSREEPS